MDPLKGSSSSPHGLHHPSLSAPGTSERSTLEAMSKPGSAGSAGTRGCASPVTTTRTTRSACAARRSATAPGRSDPWVAARAAAASAERCCGVRNATTRPTPAAWVGEDDHVGGVCPRNVRICRDQGDGDMSLSANGRGHGLQGAVQCAAPADNGLLGRGVRINRKHERRIVPSAERTPAPRPIHPSSKSAIVESPVIGPQRRSK